MSDRGWALRFISDKYQGAEYPIGGTGDLVIGRASDLDMVLIKDMVSRKHAKLHIGPAELTISDLGSTNGTFVNGEKVKTAKLKEGDRILIGTSILKLISVDKLPGEVVDRRTAQAALEKAAAQKQKSGGERSAVQGRLEEVPLVDLLQLLSTSKKTGAIVIRGIRGGRVHLRKGRVISASVDADPSLPPKKALFRMTTCGQGAFEFVPLEGEQAPMPNEITDSTEILVMEALRQGDDLAVAGLPPPTAAIGIAMPLTAKLRDLQPDEIDLVQLVHNYGVVQAVLDRADASDADTAQKLASLIQRGYLRQF